MSDLIIARAVVTCAAAPSQWDAWTPDGQYLYLRYRHCIGRIETQESPDVDTWTRENVILRFPYCYNENREHFSGSPADGRRCGLCGYITLEKFCELAGVQIEKNMTCMWRRVRVGW